MSSCDCGQPFCQGPINVEEHQRKIREYGWLSHYVTRDKKWDNIHTHGLPASLNHPDIQIAVTLPMRVAHLLLGIVYEWIKEEGPIEVGKQYDQLLDNDLKVEFIWAIECDRDVLRMILCDPDNETARDKIHEDYAFQWDDTFDSPQKVVLIQENIDYL